MTEDHEPVAGNAPTPAQDSWKTQYEPGSAGAEAAVTTPPLLASAAAIRVSALSADFDIL